MLTLKNTSVALATLTVLIGFFLVEYQITTNSEVYHAMAIKELSTQITHAQTQYMKSVESVKIQLEEVRNKYIEERTKRELLEIQLADCKAKLAARPDNQGGSPSPAPAAVCRPSLDLIGPAAGWKGRAKSYPTYKGLRHDLFGETEVKVLEDFPNFYNKSPSHLYPHTFIKPVHLDEFWGLKKPKFVVEVGSFTGGSTVVIGSHMKKFGLTDVAFLCIDTWLGDLNMWLNKAVWDFLDVRNGRPAVFDQWALNVKAANLTDIVLPLSTTSLIGARFLKAHNYEIDFLYLDSAHELDETFFELELYWDLMSKGGVLAGDDWNWDAVRIDVTKFAALHELTVQYVAQDRGAGGPWFLVKP
jgi:hypothetical protein